MMNEEVKELLTIKEFAAASGTSPQNIYKQLTTRLKPYVQIVKGKKMIHRIALQDVFYIEIEQPKQAKQVNSTQKVEFTTEKTTENQLLITLFQTTINTLHEQLQEKDEQLREKDCQIKEKDKQIEQLGAALSNEQQLHAVAIKQNLELTTAAPDEKAAVMEQPPSEQAQAPQQKRKATIGERFRFLFKGE